MNNKGIAFFILFLVNLILINVAFASQPIKNNMIFFGDSLSDVGNNTWILMDGEIGAPITNLNNQNHKYLWPNYLVTEKLKKEVYPSSQINLAPFNDNVSYAYASADSSDNYLNTDWPQKDTPAPYINQSCTQPGVIKDEMGTIVSTCVPGLLKQVDIYLAQVKYKPNSKTIFFIWVGANDLLNYYTAYMSHSFLRKLLIERFSLPSTNELDKIELQAVSHINASKKKLIDAGVKAEMIYILNLPDLSRTPAVRTNNSWALKILYGKKNLEKSLSDMSRNFNQKLQSQQSEEKYSIPVSHYVSIWNLLDDIISHPDKYHLNNISESCAAKQAMPACIGFLFYNARHPTTAVNKIIADNVLTMLSE